MTQAGSRYFVHVVKEDRGMENDVIVGGISGKRKARRTKNKMANIVKKQKRTFH